jgi:hypothetical protein
MNSLDIILYVAGAGALFLLYVVAYSAGHRDGKREGYARGRSINRITTRSFDYDPKAIFDKIIKDEIKKQVAK